MPRRTYNYKAGRRRASTTEGAPFLALQRSMERQRPAPTTLPTDIAKAFEHRPNCRGSSLGTFQGSRGDLMARCHTCGALRPVTNTQETS